MVIFCFKAFRPQKVSGKATILINAGGHGSKSEGITVEFACCVFYYIWGVVDPISEQ